MNLITEYFVTKSIRKYLEGAGWKILAFDFPQSGTGFVLHPNETISKNKDSIIPDLVARKGDRGVLFENKERFYLPDFVKVNALRTTDTYHNGLISLFGGKIPLDMNYGIGLAEIQYQVDKAQLHLNLIDFLAVVPADGSVKFSYPNQNFLI